MVLGIDKRKRFRLWENGPMAFRDKEFRREFCMVAALFVAVASLLIGGLSLSHALGYWPHGQPVASTATAAQNQSNRTDEPRSRTESTFTQWLIFVLTIGSVLVVSVLYYLGRRATSRPAQARHDETLEAERVARSGRLVPPGRVPQITGSFSGVKIRRHGLIIENREDKQQWMLCGLHLTVSISTSQPEPVRIVNIRMATHRNAPPCRSWLPMVPLTDLVLEGKYSSQSFQVEPQIEYLYDGGNAIPSSLDMIVIDEFGAEHPIHLKNGEVLPGFPVPSPHVEEYPVRDALNFKITNETMKAGLGGVELRLNCLRHWDGHRSEFMTVSGFRPLVLYADQIDLPYRITRTFKILDMTDRQNPRLAGKLDGTEHRHALGGHGVWEASLDLLYGGGHYSFTSYIQWTERGGPEFISNWPPPQA